MKTLLPLCILLFLLSPIHAGSTTWPAFRGHGDSASEAVNLPSTWSDSENIAWRITIAGYAQSSPVVWNDLVFTTSTEGSNKETMRAHAINLADGSIAWSKSIPATLEVPNGDMVSRAAPTPVVDAHRVYFFFESGDLVAFAHDGEELWKRALTTEYGDFLGGHGLGSSPANAPGSLAILVDQQGPSYLLNIDKKTGKNLWKAERPERGSWSSPIFDQSSGRDEILINSNGVAQSYDLASGDLLWSVDGIEGNTVSAPSATKEWVVAASSQPGFCVGVRRPAKADDEAEVLWEAERATSGFCSPLIHEGRVYFVSDAGVARCNDLEDGHLLWEARVAGSCWASPVAAAGHLYFFAKNGYTTVLKLGEGDDQKPELVANNQLKIEDNIVYGVAFVDGRILVRTGTELICVADQALE